MLGIAQLLVLLLQGLQLVVAECQIFQLFKLVAEQLLACALFFTGFAQTLQFVAGLSPALCGELYLAGQLFGACVSVQQAAVGVVFQQRLVFMLAVDVNEQFAKRLEISLGAGAAVDVGAGASFTGDNPAQDAGAILFKVAFTQPLASFGDLADVEAGENIGLVAAWTYDAAVGPVAQGQAQRVEHD